MANAPGARSPAPPRDAAVERAGLLAGTADPALDRVARLAARLLGAPVALVTLVDAERQRMPGVAGLEVRELPVTYSVCRHVVEGEAALVVPDAAAHPLLAGAPAVVELGVGAYAGVPLRDPEGFVLGSVCVIDREARPWDGDVNAVLHDLAETAADELALRRTVAGERAARARVQDVVAAAPLVLFALDAEGRFTVLEGSAARRLPRGGAGLLGRSVFEVCAHLPAVTGNCRRALAGETFSEAVAVGDAVFETRYAPGEDGGITGVATDVTERVRSERRAAHLARHDVLTGLPTRTAFDGALADAIAAGGASPAAVVAIDLDHFGSVNAALGHAAGDALLHRAAERMAAIAPPGALARTGADEFAVLLRGLGPDADAAAVAARAVAELLIAACSAPFTTDGEDVVIGATAGIAVWPAHAGDPDALLRHAFAALRRAKRSGRGSVATYVPRNEQHRERLSLTRRLHRAIERDELVLHFQPIHRIATGEVLGVESLVRWQDPERGLVPPGVFIPHAEETGQIERVGAWVLDAVCAQAAAWQALGLTPRVGFNVAPRQLLRASFAADVADAVARHGITAPQLTMEVTESAAMQEPEQVVPLLRELRALGLRVAIDDFGAHHSSLARLRSLPADILKVDRAFLRDVPGDRDAGAVLTAIVRLAGALGLQTVCEGIETAEQLAFLAAHGCPLGQGFHLGRPVPAPQATALLLEAAAAPRPPLALAA